MGDLSVAAAVVMEMEVRPVLLGTCACILPGLCIPSLFSNKVQHIYEAMMSVLLDEKVVKYLGMRTGASVMGGGGGESESLSFPLVVVQPLAPALTVLYCFGVVGESESDSFALASLLPVCCVSFSVVYTFQHLPRTSHLSPHLLPSR